MVKINDKKRLELSKLINTSDESKKITVMHAIALYITELTDSKMTYKTFTNNVLELGILPRTSLENIVTTYNKLRYGNKVINNLAISNTYLDVLGIGLGVSETDIEAINKNILLFKQVIIALNNYYGKSSLEVLKVIEGA